jgi:polyisoprenoid-binding protein YceI
MRKLILAATSVLLLSASLMAQTKKIEVDTNHTMFGFKASTFLFSVPGRFQKYDVKLDGDPAHPDGGSVTVTLQTASINTGIAGRDNHLRSADFFDAQKYPKITFTSNKIWTEGGKLMVTGFLDMHGVKKELAIPFEMANGKNGAGNESWSYQGTVTINRKDFGIGSDSIGAKISLKDNVDLNLGFVVFATEAAAPAPTKKKAAAKK